MLKADANQPEVTQVTTASPVRGMHHLLQLTLPRVATARRRIGAMVWKRLTDVACYGGECSEQRIPLRAAEGFRDTMCPAKPATHGGTPFSFTWYRIDLPDDTQYPEPLYLQWRHNGESTAYIDGMPWAGFDRQHAYHRIPGSIAECWVEVMHMGREHVFGGASLFQRNDLAWKLVNDIDVFFDIAKENCMPQALPFGGAYTDAFQYRQPPDSMDRFTRRVLRMLDDAVNAFEKRGLAAMSEEFDRAYERFQADHQGLRLCATAHAHLDPIVNWPENVGDFKAVHTFSSAHRLMDEYPELTFQFSQPALYEKTGQAEPRLMDVVRERMREGRWEMEGALYAESDVQLPCGEALARSMCIGQELSERLCGRDSTIVWLPDSFGFSASLPQIMRQCGVKYFYTTKMHWNTITHFPYSSFRWIGNDGTEVIAHLSQHYMGYMLNGLPGQLRNVEKIYRQADIHDESIAPVGFGDGGGGITAEQIERVRRVRNLYSVPRTEFGRVREFYERLEAARDSLPRFRGELYLEYHRGTFTSRRRIKALYRACERKLQTLEATHVVCGLGPVKEEYWKRMSLMQFHDVLPGSSIGVACDQVCEELERLSRELARATLEALAARGDGHATCLFNALPFERRVLWHDQAAARAYHVSIPALGAVDVATCSRVPVESHVRAEALTMGNGRMTVTFDESGQIASLSIDGRDVRLAQPGNQLVCYREMPAMFDVWEIDRQSLSEGVVASKRASLETVDESPCRVSLRFTKPVGELSSVAITYTLEADSAVLKIRYEIDWHDPESLLKAHFPTCYQAPFARFGAPYGSVLRPAQPGMPGDEAQWESVGSRWACVFDEGEGEGLFVATKDSYGFGCYRGDLNVSLVRSPIPPECDLERLAEVLMQGDGKYTDETRDTTYIDMGHHEIEIAIGLYDGNGSFHSLPPVVAETEFTPPVVYTGDPVRTVVPELDMRGTVVPCWVRPVEGGYDLRLHEVLGRRGMVSLPNGRPGGSFRRVDLRGRHLSEAPLQSVECGPHEVLSLRFQR